MSKTYTREQVRALVLKIEHFNTTDANVDILIEELGLTVEPAKPEPGTWHLTRAEGWFAWVDMEGDLSVIDNDGGVDMYPAGDPEWPDLDPATPPARVVPAEPVEMTKRQVGGLYNEMRKTDTDGAVARTHIPEWVYMGEFQKDNITATVNAALAKHGHGPRKGDLIGHMAPVVTREQVRQAVAESAGKTVFLPSAQTIDNLTDTFMALLDAS